RALDRAGFTCRGRRWSHSAIRSILRRQRLKPGPPLVRETEPTEEGARGDFNHPVGNQAADAPMERDPVRSRESAAPPVENTFGMGTGRGTAADFLFAFPDSAQDGELERTDAEPLHRSPFIG